MKIGILTYHNAANYGAAFQAYATQEAIKQMGIECEIINYTNAYRRGGYGIKKLVLRGLKSGNIPSILKVMAGSPIISLRKKRFDAFYHKRLNLSKQEYFDEYQLKSSPPLYDYYMVGSDQVWNYNHNGRDMNYLLDFVSDKNKTISYASSFGLASIPDDLKETYTRLLNGIQTLSVREKTGANIVESLTGRKVPVVLDPVFLLPKEHWESIADENICVNEPYILLYTAKASDYDKFLRITKYNIKGNRVAYLCTTIRLKDMLKREIKIALASSPEQFLGLIKNAKLVLTSSFHGTSLAVIFQKQFISFLDGNEGKDARIVGILNLLGLSNRILTDTMTKVQIDAPVSYEAVQNRLNDLRKESLSFLKKALNISNNEIMGE